ncbi:MAG: 23S rRNA (pseudouridine(1915)-N(3))-methyltransferase RlmH [Clostridia bacterium]|nr:23S rRNA (pseudouridine(1915)-N(3))-methyltransferase RlmH [Clostridia bacterium]
MRFTVLAIGKIKEQYLRDAISDYSKRLSRFAQIEVIELPEGKSVREEGESQLKRLPEKAYIVALDLAGKEIDSPKLAGLIDKTATDGYSHICFVIGGAEGISPEITDRADFRFCMSKLTFTHQMARFILFEQLYRAEKIINNEAYHK